MQASPWGALPDHFIFPMARSRVSFSTRDTYEATLPRLQDCLLELPNQKKNLCSSRQKLPAHQLLFETTRMGTSPRACVTV